MGKTSIAIKGAISNTMESIRRMFEFINRSITTVSEGQENTRVEVEDTEYVYKLRPNSIRCVSIGPQQVIICYDQYIGKVI